MTDLTQLHEQFTEDKYYAPDEVQGALFLLWEAFKQDDVLRMMLEEHITATLTRSVYSKAEVDELLAMCDATVAV